MNLRRPPPPYKRDNRFRRARHRPYVQKLGAGRGVVGKTAVVGVKDRGTKQVSVRVVERTDAVTLQGLVLSAPWKGQPSTRTSTPGYRGFPNHETVRHSVAEYVRDMAYRNRVESFWALLKRGYHGVYHHMSPKHLQRYVNEFAGRYSIRDIDTIRQMEAVVAGLVGKRLRYRELTSD